MGNAMKYRSESDAQLLVHLRKGDHKAFSEIYQRHRQLLIAFAYKKLQDEDLAKDFVQDLFLGIWVRRANLNVQINLPAYLITCLKNSFFNFYEHQKVESKYIKSLEEYVNTGSIAHADYLVRENETQRLIEQATASLPKKMRKIFDMHRQSNLTYKEIAKTLNLSEKTVNVQMLNALNRLRSKLSLVLAAMFYWF